MTPNYRPGSVLSERAYGWRNGEPCVQARIVGEVLVYERDVLGNPLSVSESVLQRTWSLPADRAVWVYFDRHLAFEKSGCEDDVIRLELPRAMVLATDGEGGCLVVRSV